MIPLYKFAGNRTRAFRAISGGGGGGVAGYDDSYASVELLLRGNGANASTTILDSSAKYRAMTQFGNLQNSTGQVKYGPAALLMDGSGDYVTTPYSTTDFQWWGSDFTIEAWVYPTSYTGWSSGDLGSIIGNASPTANTVYWGLGIDSTGKLYWYYWVGGVQRAFATETVPLNAWTHVAMTHKVGSGVQLWTNGVGMASYHTVSLTPQHSVGVPLTVGQVNNSCPTGYIDDLRVTKGVARYTADFTPPAGEHPLVRSTAVKGLLHFDDTHGSTTYTDELGHAFVNNNTNYIISNAQSKFGGTSLRLNGVGCVRSSSSEADFGLGTGDFCVECWVRLDSNTGTQFVWDMRPLAAGAGPVLCMYSNAWQVFAASGWRIVGPAPNPGNWEHVAVVRRNGVLALFVNGVKAATTYSDATDYGASQYFVMGAPADNLTGFTAVGYLDDVRITVGDAVYVEDFTPPTAAHPNP